MLAGKKWIFPAGVLLCSAAMFFGMWAFVIDRAPKKVTAAIQAKIAAGAGGWNACYHNRKYGPRAASARRANPDSIISSMAYDLSGGPVRVSGTVWPRYWSLSLYQQNTDNFFVINDQDLPGADFDFLITMPGQQAENKQATQIVSPTKKGIMLIRRFAAGPEDMPGIIEGQDQMFCGPEQRS